MKALRYEDFDLRIERDGPGYTARVLGSPAGEAVSAFTLSLSADKLENLILKIGRRLSGSFRGGTHSIEMQAARDLGCSLFEALFTGQVRDCYTRSLDQISSAEGTGLRFRLRLQDVPELADLPWEFVYDRSQGRFLAQSVQTPIVRYMEMSQTVRPLAMTLPLRVLVMMSSPVDAQQLDLQRERERLEMALEPLRLQNKLEVTWLERATLSELLRRFRNETYHIFHFIGHGAFDPKRDAGLLILEDDQERAFPTEADRIGIVLHDHASLRLAVLNSCDGARNSRTDPFAGVAANLVRQGIPAVVAMQFEISDGAAITFAGEFYAALAEGFSVDAAVAEARKAIFAQPNDVEWATPVLYMRSNSGLLFKLEPDIKRSSSEGKEPRPTPPRPAPAPAPVPVPIPIPVAAAAPAPPVVKRKTPSGAIWAGSIGAFLFLLALLSFADLAPKPVPSSPPPISVPVPPPPPQFASGEYDIPALQARITQMQFYEGPKDGVVADERVFKTGFNGRTTRYIWLQLDLTLAPLSRETEANVPCRFYRDGEPYAIMDQPITMEPGWVQATWVTGWGTMKPGSWPPGPYSAACTVDGRVVAQGSFEVY